MAYRIGCDVGGTNTDAAILDISRLLEKSQGVLATYKTPTTQEVTSGITTAIQNVINKSQIDVSRVLNVAIGTTHFVNAVVENDAQRLSKNPPFSDYPYSLRDVVEGPCFYLDGGLEIDGRDIKPLNLAQVREVGNAIVKEGVNAIAIVGVFSALDHDGRQEEQCKKILQDAHPHLSVVCSRSIGGPGLLARENATILNAAILSFAKQTINSFQLAMTSLGLTCPLFLTQNDGTLIEASLATELPIKTFASGPTNSLMGAAFLTELQSGLRLSNKQVLVVDIGGTTTDVAALLPSGFPRKAPNFVEIGGVRTEFSMPEVHSVGLGGGSRVRILDNGKVTVGPDSVGFRLTKEAMVFGGSVLTATDIMVASGDVQLGDPSLVKSISKETITAAKKEITVMIERAVEKMKVSAEPVAVLLVGGGSIVFPKDSHLEHLLPQHHDSANAIGAAMAKVAGDVDIIEIMETQDEDLVKEKVNQMATEAAVARGADPDDIRIAEFSKIPLQYATNNATRYVVKAVGKLVSSSSSTRTDTKVQAITLPETKNPVVQSRSVTQPTDRKLGSLAKPLEGVDLETYSPEVRNKVWYVSPVDVQLLATGCGVLGTGGGGSPYHMALYVLDIMHREGAKKIRIVQPESLQDSDLCCFGAGYGAPSVSDERISSGKEVFDAVEKLNSMLGYYDFQGIVADEIGGGNGLVTFPTGAHFDRPIVDCDLMGRAYPTIEHATPYVYGESPLPCAVADSKGNVGVIVSAENNTKLESLLRNMCTELGNAVAVASKPSSGKIIKKLAIPNTVSQAWYLGRAVHLARQSKVDFIEAIGDVTPVKLLYTGKIIDVTQEVVGGYTVGKCTMNPLSVEELEDRTSSISNEQRKLVIIFQNEYLAAYHTSKSDTGETVKEPICTVPDLISILGSDGEALGSPDLRYGLQVRVIAMPAHPLWSGTPEGLKIGGPEFFGLDMEWKAVGEYRRPKSVIEEFNKQE